MESETVFHNQFHISTMTCTRYTYRLQFHWQATIQQSWLVITFFRPTIPASILVPTIPNLFSIHIWKQQTRKFTNTPPQVNGSVEDEKSSLPPLTKGWALPTNREVNRHVVSNARHICSGWSYVLTDLCSICRPVTSRCGNGQSGHESTQVNQTICGSI